MRLKPGVSLRGIRPETVVGMFIADGVYLRVTGHEMTVTSGTEGTHSPGSLHYVGLGFDSRTHYDDGSKWPEGMLEKLIVELRAALGGTEFDVVREDTHLHNEFQPKALKTYALTPASTEAPTEALTGNDQGNLLKISVELRV